MSFWSELKRRNVYKVAVAYAIVAWLILQVVSITFPALNLPTWALTLLTVFIIVCFPLVLIFAWAFEITPEGLKLTKDVPKHESITHITGQKLNYILIGVIVLAVAFILFDNLYLDRRAIETEVASRVAELASPTDEEEESTKTIAVLPFVNLSPDPDQEYFVDGLTEELLNSLAQIPELTVIARTSSFSFKGTTKTIQEIAEILDVANILEGSVRKAGNELRITAQLVRTTDGAHLWSKNYDRKLEDIFKVQEDIATAVAGELKTTLGIKTSIKMLGGTDKVEAYELYLLSLEQENFEEALKKLDAAIELDPEFALAWVEKSFTHQRYSMMGPSSNAASEQDASLSAALKAIELQPALPEGYSALGDIKTAMGEFIEAASAYEKASELNVGPSWNFGYIFLLNDVAYFKKAHDLLKEARLVDPLNERVRGDYIENLGYLGDLEQAEKENERCMALFGHDWGGNLFLTNARLGSGQTISRDQIVIEEYVYSTVHDLAKKYLESPKEALLELRRYYAETENLNNADLTSIAYWAAYFGDPELSMDSIDKAINTDTGNINNYWYPLFKGVRQLPRFKELIRKIGLVDYWEQFGWPDICQPTDDGDFACD